MPQLISDALVNHGKLKPSHDVKVKIDSCSAILFINDRTRIAIFQIIDLGCGDGLVGLSIMVKLKTDKNSVFYSETPS